MKKSEKAKTSIIPASEKRQDKYADISVETLA
jgi:hypothetical protein